MTEASKKRSRDDIPCVPIGSPVWIVKSWREMPAGTGKWNYGIEYDQKDYCVHGVFATVEAANAEARWTRDCELEIEDEGEGDEEGEGKEEEENENEGKAEEEEEEEGADEKGKKVNDEEPFVYFRPMHEDEDDDNVIGDLHIVVEKFDLR